MRLTASHPRFFRALGLALVFSSGPVIWRLLLELSGTTATWGGVLWGTAFSLIGFATLFFAFPNLLSDRAPAWFLRALSKLLGEDKR